MYLSSDEVAQLLFKEVGGLNNLKEIQIKEDRLILKLASRKLVREEGISKIPGITGLVDDRDYFAVLTDTDETSNIGQSLERIKDHGGQIPQSFWQKFKEKFKK